MLFKAYNSYIPLFPIVNLLCFGGYFSSITFIDAKTKYRSPYFLDTSQPYLHNHVRTFFRRGCPRNLCRRRLQDVGRVRHLALHIGHYGYILRTLSWNVLQEVIFQRPKDVGDRGRPLALHSRPYGNVHRISFGEVLRT